MARKASEVFSKAYNPASRSDHIDYDYLDKLNETELNWLAKFTDEHYSAAFDMNTAYMLKTELLELINQKLNTVKTDRLQRKWENHWHRVTQDKHKFIQISNLPKKSENIDLRTVRKFNVFYKDNEGHYTTSDHFKYANNTINDINNTEVWEECQDRSKVQNRCVLSMFGATPIENDDVMDFSESILGPEEFLIKMEELSMEESLDTRPDTKDCCK